ncbi:MAG: hypothetical protein R3C19_17110 [Planctomycetaceae bacterium]
MRIQVTPRTIRRLLAADGYLELQMPHKAVAELQKAGEAGPLEGPRQLMLGVATKQAGDLESAIPHLESAARLMPSPVRSFAWSELVNCYRFVGSEEMADLAETLGGDRQFELRIALPFGQINLHSTESSTEVV